MPEGVARAEAVRRAAADEAERTGPACGRQASQAAAGAAAVMLLPGGVPQTLDGARHPRLAQCVHNPRVLRSYMA